MKYKSFQRTKIYQGNYEIREYEWEALLNKGMGAKLELCHRDSNGLLIADEWMYIPLHVVRKMQVINTVMGPESGQQYKMRAIKWNPDKKEKEEEKIEINPQVRGRLSEMYKQILTERR